MFAFGCLNLPPRLAAFGCPKLRLRILPMVLETLLFRDCFADWKILFLPSRDWQYSNSHNLEAHSEYRQRSECLSEHFVGTSKVAILNHHFHAKQSVFVKMKMAAHDELRLRVCGN